jgi:hypothetical protein
MCLVSFFRIEYEMGALDLAHGADGRVHAEAVVQEDRDLGSMLLFLK